METRPKRWMQDQARRVVDEFVDSGLTLAEFARRRGHSRQRIHRWRKRFDEEAKVAAPRMVELFTAPQPSKPSPRYSLRLCCPSGYVIEVSEVGLAEGVSVLLACVPGGASC